jgi:hypothetical protein
LKHANLLSFHSTYFLSHRNSIYSQFSISHLLLGARSRSFSPTAFLPVLAPTLPTFPPFHHPAFLEPDVVFHFSPLPQHYHPLLPTLQTTTLRHPKTNKQPNQMQRIKPSSPSLAPYAHIFGRSRDRQRIKAKPVKWMMVVNIADFIMYYAMTLTKLASTECKIDQLLSESGCRLYSMRPSFVVALMSRLITIFGP